MSSLSHSPTKAGKGMRQYSCMSRLASGKSVIPLKSLTQMLSGSYHHVSSPHEAEQEHEEINEVL